MGPGLDWWLALAGLSRGGRPSARGEFRPTEGARTPSRSDPQRSSRPPGRDGPAWRFGRETKPNRPVRGARGRTHRTAPRREPRGFRGGTSERLLCRGHDGRSLSRSVSTGGGLSWSAGILAPRTYGCRTSSLRGAGMPALQVCSVRGARGRTHRTAPRREPPALRDPRPRHGKPWSGDQYMFGVPIPRAAGDGCSRSRQASGEPASDPQIARILANSATGHAKHVRRPRRTHGEPALGPGIAS